MKVGRNSKIVEMDLKIGDLVLITDESYRDYLEIAKIIQLDLRDFICPVKVESNHTERWISGDEFLTLKEAIKQGYDTFTIKDSVDTDFKEGKIIAKVDKLNDCFVVGRFYDVKEGKYCGNFNFRHYSLSRHYSLNKYVDINIDDKTSKKDTLKVITKVSKKDTLKVITNKIDSKAKENVVKIANDLIDLYVRKNDDYGDSFNRGREIFGEIGGEVRISDKLFRFQALYKNEDKAKVSESLTDTVLDLVNYTSMHRVKDLNKVESLGEIYNNIIEILLNPSFVLTNLKNNSVNLEKILDDKLIEDLAEFINDIVGR